MSFNIPTPPPLVPPSLPAPSGPPVLGTMPTGQRPGKKPATPTFLGTSAVPGPASGDFGGKTLLGT